MSYERKRWHTHVFTSTYTADVSGVCSAMYELGGMTILHDPSGCNSTYTTHDEPRWYDSKSLMFVSGLDEMTAVMGDDSVLIRDAVRAAADLKPRFITLCGASIPHIISFDFKGVARLIERETGIPVLPVATDGLRSYISGAGLAFREWIRRFGDPEDAGREDAGHKNAGLAERLRQYGVNLLGVTPIDFSRQEIVDAMKQAFTDAGIPVNTCFAMGDSFETLTGVYRGAVNVVVSSAGRIPARFMKGAAGIPFVEGLPLGREMTDRLLAAVRETAADGKDRRIFEEPGTGKNGAGPQDTEAGTGASDTGDGARVPHSTGILVIGEEIFSRTLAAALGAEALWPSTDEGLDEDILMEKVNAARLVIGDPLFRTVLRNPETKFSEFPHEGYSGRIFRDRIPVFTGRDFKPEDLLVTK
ncbi:MAG: oxidoreductase [Stomatobaculum sp.]|nr:oxidoreductase [Stomatobaculum sp.]